jgi:outer membrane biosynthesis protein TonB
VVFKISQIYFTQILSGGDPVGIENTRKDPRNSFPISTKPKQKRIKDHKRKRERERERERREKRKREQKREREREKKEAVDFSVSEPARNLPMRNKARARNFSENMWIGFIRCCFFERKRNPTETLVA